MKKYIALVLALIFVALPICSCKNNDGPTVNEDGVVLLEEPIVIADASGAYFTVVKPDSSTEIIDSCVSALAKPADGFTLKHAVAKKDGNGNTDKEILIGFTCRAESAAAMESIGYDDYSITYSNNKIIVAAHNPERLSEAVTFLKEKLLKVTDGKLEYIGNYTYESSDALMIGEGDSIDDYKIVCGDDSLYMSAQSIQKYVKAKYGVQLEIIYDTKPKDSKEIVLGNAKRDICALADGLGMGEGIIAVKDKDLLIAAKDITTTLSLFDIFTEEYISGLYTDTFNFKADFETTVNVYKDEFKDSNKVSDGSDIRVMSFNVLVDIWSDTPAVKGRDTTVAKTLMYYAPDVVGLQEASATWHKNLKSLLKNTPYKLICTEHEYVDAKYGNLNFVPILYNSETLTLKDSGTREYTSAHVKYMRTISWALFEKVEGKEQFIVVNTHYEAPGKNAEEKAEYLEHRKKQTADMIKFLGELEDKYDLPILLTGDFNTTEGNDKTGHHSPYWNIINSGMHEAKYTADVIKRACSTWHELGASVSTAPDGSFDHIFGNDKIKFTYFNTLVDKMLINAADHCPIYADVKFK